MSYTLAPFSAMTANRQSRLSTNPLKALFTLFTNWNNVRRTHKALAALDDHLLRDIGLDRSDIQPAALQGWLIR